MIYLASPYSHEDPAVREHRFRVVCRVAARLMRHGHLIFSPIAHSHCIAEAGGLPTGWTFWEEYDRRMMRACDEVWVVMMEGWDRSQGVKAEIEYMKAAGKTVEYIRPTTEELAARAAEHRHLFRRSEYDADRNRVGREGANLHHGRD